MTPDQALRSARSFAASTTGGLLLLVAVIGWIPPLGQLEALVFPVGLLGIVSPLVGFRLLEYWRERARGADTASACNAYAQGHMLALAVTEVVGFLGAVAFLLAGRIATLIGVLTHVILAGAIWPTEESLERFLGTERP